MRTRTRTRAAALALGCTIGLMGLAGQARAAVPMGWLKGANLDSWWFNEWEQTSTDQSIQALRATNSTDATFVVTWYMATKTSSTFAPSATMTPSDAGLLRAMAYARSLGMRPSLNLHVDVADGTWRGLIAPADVNSWFQSYNGMVAHYARLAQQAGASLLVIGSELNSMQGYASQWRQMVATARANFSGALTFAANWVAGAQHVSFWDVLDYIGVDAYMPLSSPSNPNPTVPQLVAGWSPYVGSLGSLVARFGKPAIFTEIGYQSLVGTAVTPWYVSSGAVSQVAQQAAYEAAYEVFTKVPWFCGFIWWDWAPSGYNPNDGQFNPRGKLAQQTMSAWNARLTPSPTPSQCGTVASGKKKRRGQRHHHRHHHKHRR